MKISVGSLNPVKINAVKDAFETMFPESKCEAVGIDVESDVSDQPLSDKESIKGETNRAKYARDKTDADYGVGLESGIQKLGGYYFTTGWAAVIDREGRCGIGSSISMRIPGKVMALVRDGKEMGDAIDVVFKGKNLKQQHGFFGRMTNNAITRTHGFRDGVISALSRFTKKEVFED